MQRLICKKIDSFCKNINLVLTREKDGATIRTLNRAPREGGTYRKGSIGMKNVYSVNFMMMPMMRMFSMCMIRHGENGHFLSKTV